MSKSNYLSQIQKGLAELNLQVPEKTVNTMLDFLLFLQKWNNSYNLTAINDIERMITHHLFDSLSIAPYIKGERVLDVGTGAGFPGIPLAMIFPDKKFVLIDGNGKKIRFLVQARAEFKIDNIVSLQHRVEDFRPTESFDTVLFRAVGAMADFIRKASHVCRPGGQFLFMKGAYPEEELQALEKPATIHPLKVPGLEAERCLVVVEQGPGSNKNRLF